MDEYRIIEGETGSSPLARGTPPAPPSSPTGCRFIPARAGNTGHGARSLRRPPVHPRSRGEHSCGIVPESLAHGSSPLARGTPPQRGLLGRNDRFIPARAGNTCPPAGWAPPTAVHPRSRGEHALGPELQAARAGSSPLARGTPRRRRQHRQRLRFIPARAGNTCSWAPGGATRSVHPRSRGEHRA